MADGLSRRGFLSGIVKAATAAELIIAATPEQVEAFGVGHKVNVGESVDSPFGYVSMGELLFNYKGLPVAVVEDIRGETQSISVSSFDDPMSYYMPGITKWKLTAVTHGPTNIRVR